jgi:Fe-S oxidoreductase
MEGGTMCPSFMATREEMHSTRGRARLLFELLQGEVIGNRGWREAHVKEALDLCLSCKACKSECPMNVDMATYRAEFFSHYYKRHARPLVAYTMGLIPWWSRSASCWPGLANLFSQTPFCSVLFKRFAGIAPERSLPVFARQTFKHWFVRRRERLHVGPRVILWPDTFNNHFFTGTAKAAVETLESLGFAVIVPMGATLLRAPPIRFRVSRSGEKLFTTDLERTA